MTRQPVIVASSQSIESQLDEVGKSIKSVEEEIKQNTAAIGSTTDAKLLAFLMDEKKQLREDKKQLREDKKQLRDELKDLRDKEQQLSKQRSDDAEMVDISTFVLICLFFYSSSLVFGCFHLLDYAYVFIQENHV